jgi:Platelet-activating factor acetylhydrolase, isoform II
MFKRLVGLLPMLLLLCVAPMAQTAASWNVGYRKIDVQDPLTGEPFPVALWYPTPAAPAPLFVTGSLSVCRLPAVLCRWVAFEIPVAHNAPPAAGHFGLIVVSHGAGGLAVNHRDLAIVLASQGYVVAAPTHPRGQDNDISGVGEWVGRPKQVSRVIDAVLEDRTLGLTSRASASGLWAIRTVATPRWQSPVPRRVSAQPSRIANSIPTTPGSAPLAVRLLGKPPARSAPSPTSAIRGCGLSCSWRRTRRASPTPRWQKSPFPCLSMLRRTMT